MAKVGLKRLETSLCRVVHNIFDILNRVGVNHQCDRQTDGQNCDSNSVRLTTRAKKEKKLC